MRYYIIQNRQGRVIAQRRSLNRAIEFIESQSKSSRNEFVIYDIHNGEKLSLPAATERLKIYEKARFRRKIVSGGAFGLGKRK